MSAVSPITRQTVGRTFIVAISVLGLGALAQLAIIVWFFVARFHAVPTGEPLAGPTAAPALPKSFVDPFSDPAAATPAAPPAGTTTVLAGRAPITAPPRPAPVPQNALAPMPLPTEQDRFNELVEQARTLREHGDTYAAVTKLREAQATDPNNPMASAELAMTYEKMGFSDQAAKNWRRVYEMGPAAGIYYEAARGKRDAAATREAVTTAVAPGATPTADPSAPATATPPGEVVGLGPNSKLGLGQLNRRDETDAAATRKFTLEVPVRAKARARIDVRDVIVQVLFYDVVNAKALDRTNAQVSYKWGNPPADWSESDIESLEVSYLLPAKTVTDEDRKYYGYIVSVYYKNALQDFRADPPALGQRLPPKRLLSSDSAE